MRCLFCGIVAGTEPASRVYEDANTLAFMNIRQGNAGHVLVIPKLHIETIDQLPLALAGDLFQTVVRVSQAINQTIKPDGLNIWQSNGEGAGQEIPHIHIHLFPRWNGDDKVQFYKTFPPHAERAYLDQLAETIRDGF
jgi:histidine triad (HIT) family protein